MIINLVPQHHADRTCFEDLIASIAISKNRRYEMIFSKAWNFCFLPIKEELQACIGTRLDMQRENYLYLFERYHGIKVSFFNIESVDEVMDVISMQLAINQPVAIKIDSFWCPWFVNYQRIHSKGHVALVVGLNKLSGELYCTDPFYMVQNVPITIGDFNQGYSGSYAIFTVVKEEECNINWKEMLLNSVANLKINNAFVGMKDFAEAIKCSLDFSVETQGYDSSLVGVPLFEGLLQIGKGRLKYSLVLQYLAEKYSVDALLPLCEDIKMIGSKWMIIRGILYKAYYSQQNSITLYKDRVAAKIIELSYEEENISIEATKIAEKYDGRHSFSSTKNFCGYKDNYIEITETDFIYLEPYYNKGFGEFQYSECISDLTGNGKYFLIDGLPKIDIWEVHNMKFKFPSINNYTNDNISCMGQTIITPDKLYTTVMLLGCSDWENFSEKMTIRYTDGKVEHIPIEFSDWELNPAYGETVAWEGKAVERVKEQKSLLSKPVHLFCKMQKLKCPGFIECIILPECPNIHVFAITLGKS